LVCLIPVMGAPLTLLSPLLVGLLTSVETSLLAGLYTLAVLIAVGIWVRPRLFNRSLSNPMLTVLLLVALFDAFGLLGILVAPPLAIVAQVLWNRLVSQRAAAGNAAQLSDLQERLSRLQALIKAQDEPSHLVTSSVERLTELLAQAEPILQAGETGLQVDESTRRNRKWQIERR
jgi:putative permease